MKPTPNKTMNETKPFTKAIFGVIAVENVNSNPNGDPDNDGNPRVCPVTLGNLISAESIKRKVKDHIHRRTPTFLAICEKLGINQREIDERFNVYIENSRTAADCAKEYKKDPEAFYEKFVEARLFGQTNLTKGENDGRLKAGGPIFFGMLESLQPAEVFIGTNTRAQGMSGDKKEDFAPNSIKVVRYSLCTGIFGFSPDTAKENQTTEQDVRLFFELLPHAYSFKSVNRAGTEIVQMWTLEKPLTLLLSHEKFRQLVSPEFIGENTNVPATGRKDYRFKTEEEVLKALKAKTSEEITLKVIDLA